ncbi:MAG TPA: hypothetical protein GX713_01185 [Mollicutes bacterium]|nr:hypothetical protein [Mollicutes bacterium]
MEKNITIKIFTLSKGLVIKDDVKLIRIKSSKYNLLILPDYLPIIGEIEGSIDIETVDDTLNYQDINAYYMHSNNIFNLIIKEG